MTTFIDGPAKGQNLMLQRTPMLLRVVTENGKWDALNAVGDEPRPGEQIFAYVMSELHGHCHVNRGRNGSGFYSIAAYRLAPVQPSQEEMRDRTAWTEWCNANKHLVAHLT